MSESCGVVAKTDLSETLPAFQRNQGHRTSSRTHGNSSQICNLISNYIQLNCMLDFFSLEGPMACAKNHFKSTNSHDKVARIIILIVVRL